MSLTNVYHVRRVADTSAKACLICYKPSTSVMITPDNKVCNLIFDLAYSVQDYFYTLFPFLYIQSG